MAKLEFQGNSITDPQSISELLRDSGVVYESWGLRGNPQDEADLLQLYHDDIGRLKEQYGYVAADLVALSVKTPNLDAIQARFSREHHHADDEVRFTVEGEGVFEIASPTGEFLKFTAEPGDLIIIPAAKRHLFYLTDQKYIRCIRLFRDTKGWEALY